MIGNQLFNSNQQPQQAFPLANQVYPGANFQAAPSGASGSRAPPVDMSHLTAQERSMIQSVMAKAEMADGRQAAGMSSQALRFQQPQQQQPQLTPMIYAGQQQQQLRPPFPNAVQHPQFQVQQTGAFSQNLPLRPANGAAMQGPPSLQAQFPHQQFTLQSQQQHQPPLHSQPQSQQMQQHQMQDSSRDQLPLLEQRTQQLISQINSQFKLGGASASADQQHPKPTGNTHSAFPQPQSQTGLSAGQQFVLPQQAHQNVQLTGPQQFNLSSQMPVGTTSAQAGMPDFYMQNTHNQNLGLGLQQHQATFANQTIMPNQPVPGHHHNPAQSVQPLVGQFAAGNQFGLAGGPAGFSSQQNPYDPRQLIKFGHESSLFGAQSDQDDFADRDRRGWWSRQTRAARLSRFKSADMADELYGESQADRTRRWRNQRDRENADLRPTPMRRLPRPNQQQALGLDREMRGRCAGRDPGRRRATPTPGRDSRCSDFLSGEDELASSSSGSEAASRNSTSRHRSQQRMDNDRKPARRREAQSSDRWKSGGPVDESSNLLSELKLNEQTSQVMEQQQQLIKQSQELIKLQQAQLEHQMKTKKDTDVVEEPTNEPSSKHCASVDEMMQDETQAAKLAEDRVLDSGRGKVETKQTGSAGRRHIRTGPGATSAEANQETRNISSDSEPDKDRPMGQIDGRDFAGDSQRHRSFKSRRSKFRPELQSPQLFDSPTSSIGSDDELLSCVAGESRRGHRRRAKPSSAPGRKCVSPRPATRGSGLTPSPLPVIAAIQLHELQRFNQKGGRQTGSPERAHGWAGRARRPDLLRSRSVCNSPQMVARLSRARPSSPEAPDDFLLRGNQRKLLPDPPTNAVPLTPSMVRNMIETQRIAATSSSKLLTSVNAQSTLLTNTHSLRQPCLDYDPRSTLARSRFETRSGLKPIGSYTAKISGAQVSFAPLRILAGSGRHNKLSTSSRADLSKFLDSTYGASILKSSYSRNSPNFVASLKAPRAWHSPEVGSTSTGSSLVMPGGPQDLSVDDRYNIHSRTYPDSGYNRPLATWRRNSAGESNINRDDIIFDSRHKNFEDGSKSLGRANTQISYDRLLSHSLTRSMDSNTQRRPFKIEPPVYDSLTSTRHHYSIERSYPDRDTTRNNRYSTSLGIRSSLSRGLTWTSSRAYERHLG